MMRIESADGERAPLHRSTGILGVVSGLAVVAVMTAKAHGQQTLETGMDPPFHAGMPDMPVDMPDVPDMPKMPDVSDVSELDGVPEFSDLAGLELDETAASPVPAPITQPPERRSQAFADKRKTLRAELDKLSQEDQRQLRRALRKAWSNREVVDARQAYREAGKRYQQALYSAMLAEDEALRPFLENLMLMGFDVAPAQSMEAYVQAARLFDVPEQRLEPYKLAIEEAYSRACSAPDVLAIRARLENTSSPSLRKALTSQLQEALRLELRSELPAIDDWIAVLGERSA